MPEVNRRWVYPTVTASQNKGIERTALSGEGTAHEVVGVDGSRRFGCRPSSGFRLAHTLDIYKDFSSSGARAFSSVAPPTQAKTSTVTDCFPVSFQIREGEFGHGFVYRVKNILNTDSGIYMDFCPTNTVDGATGWRTVLISDHSSSAGGHVSSNDKMDVVSMGKYVITLVKGRVPRVFYIDFDGTSTYTHQVVNGGPGPAPIVRGFGDTTPVSIPRSTSFPSTVIPFGELLNTTSTPANSTPNNDAPHFVRLSPGDYSFAYFLHDSHTGRRSLLSSISNRQSSQTQGSAWDTSGEYISMEAEVDINKYDQIYLFRSVKLQQVGGTYAGSILHLDTIYNISDSEGDTGTKNNASYKGITESTPVSGATASFVFGSDFGAHENETITLEDAAGTSKTYKIKNTGAVASNLEFNEGSSISECATNFAALVNGANGHNGTITVVANGDSTAGKISMTQAVVGLGDTTISHTSNWDTMCSSNPPAAFSGGNVVSGNYRTAGYRVYECFYQLPDLSLAMQDIYLDKNEGEKDMPFAGSGVAYDGTLLVSDPEGETELLTANLDSRTRNIGEIRWSSLTERSPELFPINNKYTPDVYQNRVERLAKAGEFVVGFSSDRIYHIRRNGVYLKIEDMHAGYGLAAQDAFASAGPLCYFITSKGLKAIANNGQLDDVQALDNLIMEDWKSNLSDLRMAYDPYASCLFIMNPIANQTACMWFNTGRITEIHDTNFTDIRSGMWPKTYTRNSYDNTTPTPTTSTVMVERSFFLQNHPTTTASSITDDWRPRVYILDIDRNKVLVGSTDISDGKPMLRTLDCPGDSIFTVHSVTQGSGITTIGLKSGTTGTKNLSHNSSLLGDLVGSQMYILSSSTPENVGTNETIFKHDKGTVNADGSGSIDIVTNKFSNIAVDDVITISPMKVRYIGGALPMIRSEDKKVITSFDMFQNKQISSVGCHFTDVRGGATGYKFFQGQVYNTATDSAAVTAFPLDFSGSIIGDSIKNGESDDYAAFTATGLTTTGKHGIQDSALNPGFETFVPDLDYKLMALICRGRTTGTDTGDRNIP